MSLRDHLVARDEQALVWTEGVRIRGVLKKLPRF